MIERFRKIASEHLYGPGSRACNLALQQLRDLLLDIGFKVQMKPAKEPTLRVYPKKWRQ